VIALTKLRERLAAAGAAHPDLAAAVLVARGARLLDQPGFAELLGVPLAHLRSWESGARSPDAVPRRIAAIAPELDWPAAGVTPPGHPSDPASRHPAARRR
jgi:hypothetical protein